MSYLFTSYRPKDEEVVACIPLLLKEKLRKGNLLSLLPKKNMKYEYNLSHVSLHTSKRQNSIILEK